MTTEARREKFFHPPSFFRRHTSLKAHEAAGIRRTRRPSGRLMMPIWK